MGQPNAKPVGERRAITESLALLVGYVAYSASLYHATYTWAFPLVEALFGDVFVLGSLCRGLSMAVHAAHLGVHLPCVAFVLLDKDGLFYRRPTPNVWNFDREIKIAGLFVLPWLALCILLWFTLLLFVVPAYSVTPTDASTTATTATEKQKLKPKADRATSSLGATPSTTEQLVPTTEQLVPTPKTKEPKKSLRKRVLSWFKSSKRSQPSDETATTKRLRSLPLDTRSID